MECRSCGRNNPVGRLYCAHCSARLGHFVGRGPEVERLRGALEEACSGRGRFLLLAGEPGIGKTRLSEELGWEARGRGAHVLWGRCFETEGFPAFWPWVRVIREYARGAEGEVLRETMGASAAELAQLVPEIRAELPDLPHLPTLEPSLSRFRLFESVTTFLQRAAARRPLVLILDDLQWADRPSLLLLQFLAMELPVTPLLVLGAYRSTEVTRRHPLSSTIGELARNPLVERIELCGLKRDDTARLMELIGGGPVSDFLAAMVHERTEGNPFFIGELLPLLVAGGSLPRGDSSLASLRVPQSIREAIGRRVAVLSPECSRAVTLASVIGRAFSLDALCLLGESSEEELLVLLEEAVAAHILTESPRAFGRYVFSHALIRETLYDELPRARRVRLHRRVGEVLERLYAGSIEPHLAELAYHFCESAQTTAEVGQATGYATRAAERASRLLAYEEAAALYERALSTLELRDEPDEEHRCDLLLALGQAEIDAGNAASARDAFLRAGDLARRHGMAERLARAALGLGSGLQGFWGYGAGLVDEALVRLLEESLAALGPGDSASRALALGRLAVALSWSSARSRRAAIGELAAEAVAVARRLGDPTVQLATLATRHWADWRPDNLEERLATARDMVRLAHDLDQRELELLGHAFSLADLMELGGLDAAVSEIEAFARLAEDLRQPRYRWWSITFRGMRALLAGSFAEGERLAQEALALGQRAHASDAMQTFGVQMFTLRRERGGLDELLAATEALGEEFTQVREWRMGLALLRAILGRHEEARLELKLLGARGFEDMPRDLTWLTTMVLLAETASLVGDRVRAAELYELLRPYERRCVLIPYGVACWGSVARYLGLLATTLDRFDDAERHFAFALERELEIGARPFVAHTLLAYAAMLLVSDAQRNRDRALAMLDESLGIARALEMDALAERISEELAQASMAGRAEVAPSPQSARETASVFRREGEFWTLEYEGTITRLKDTKGMRYIACLLEHAGEEIHSGELVMLGGNGPIGAGASVSQLGDAGELLDPRARAEYRRRLAELREELEEAEQANDLGRAERARDEVDMLAAQLSAAVGLGGRERRSGSTSERARLTVTKRIKLALHKITDAHPALGRHLGASVKTGIFCAYRPPTTEQGVWRL